MQTENKYYFTRGERLVCMLVAVGLSAVIAWLFYRSVWAMILLPICNWFVKRQLGNHWREKQKQENLLQFQGMLQIISGLLKAGYSMENAFLEGEQDFLQLYGTKCIMSQEFRAINHQLKMNIPIEHLLEKLAERSEIEEIDSFSQVFAFAKRQGGDMGKVFRDSTERIAEGIEVKREINTVIAAKRLEQNIMSLVPCGILLYMGMGMPEFLSPLYGNLTGVAVMSGCLGLYAGAYLLGQKIIRL